MTMDHPAEPASSEPPAITTGTVEVVKKHRRPSITSMVHVPQRIRRASISAATRFRPWRHGSSPRPRRTNIKSQGHASTDKKNTLKHEQPRPRRWSTGAIHESTNTSHQRRHQQQLARQHLEARQRHRHDEHVRRQRQRQRRRHHRHHHQHHHHPKPDHESHYIGPPLGGYPLPLRPQRDHRKPARRHIGHSYYGYQSHGTPSIPYHRSGNPGFYDNIHQASMFR